MLMTRRILSLNLAEKREITTVMPKNHRKEAVEEPRIEAQEHMLAAYPSLRDRYQPGDGNTQIFALEHVQATFSSFTDPTRVVSF